MLNVFSFPFQFSLPLIFTLHWWPPAFLILSPPLQNFHVVLASNRKMSPLFFISRSRSLLPLFSLTFADLPPTFSFSLSFSCSIFQICGHDNMTGIQKQFPLSVFVSIDSLVVFAIQDAGSYAISNQNNLELHLGYHTC